MPGLSLVLYSWGLSGLQLIFPPTVFWCLSFLKALFLVFVLFCFVFSLNISWPKPPCLSCQDGAPEMHSGPMSFHFTIFSSKGKGSGLAQKSLVASSKHKTNMTGMGLCSAELCRLALVSSHSQLLQDEHRPAVTRYCVMSKSLSVIYTLNASGNKSWNRLWCRFHLL